MSSQDTPAYLLLTLISDELNSKLVPLHLYVTVAYTPEFAKLQMLDGIDLNLEGERRRCFVVSVEPAPGAVATGCKCFTLDGKLYDPAKAMAARLIRFKADVTLIQELLSKPKVDSFATDALMYSGLSFRYDIGSDLSFSAF